MIGDLVDGRFDIDREVAAGGMGRIYLARDRQTSRPVALKVVTAASSMALQRFARESVVLAELRHPGVVDYVAHGALASGEPYLVMEWLDGLDLATWLRERGKPSIADVLVLARRIATTLAAIHARGIVHRDLKPSNLFLPGGQLARCKLIDFGIAREVTASGPALTLRGEIVGTPYYMAPEQVRGDEIGAGADIWSLGCVLYECLSGRPPFASSLPVVAMVRVLMDEPTAQFEDGAAVPASLAALIRSMMIKEPELRPASAEVVLGAIAKIEAAAAPRAVVSVTAATRDAASAPGDEPAVLDPARPQRSEHHLRERRVRVLLFAHLAESRAIDVALLRAVAARHAAEVTALAGGYLLIVQRGGDLPTDEATRGALLAFALRAAAKDLRLVLATVRAETAASTDVGVRVDAAVALLQRADAGEIVVDTVTARLLEARFEIQTHDGRSRLERRRATEEPRTLLGKASPCVGRRRELANLVATFDECVESSVPRSVLVTAAAGIGKSRLCSETLRELARRGSDVEILRGQGDSLSAGAPFVMIAPAVRRAAGILDGEPLVDRRRKLMARIGWSVPAAELPQIVGFIGELVGVPFADDHSEQLRAARGDPMLMGALMRTAFCDWLRAECSQRPVLFVLEDLHWGDQPSIQCLDVALRALRDRPFMILALARPEVHTMFPRLWSQHELDEVRLHALPTKACMEIARTALGATLSDDVVALVVARSQGNAFYLEEMIRSAAEGSVDTLPDTVIGTVQSRLSALDPEARRVLRAASVFGEVFWEGGVRALLGDAVSTFTVDEWLAELVRQELINPSSQSRLPSEREYRFRHALLRDGAYEMLVDQDRAASHLTAAQWLSNAGESDALVLAGHFERGGDRDSTIRMLTRAAEQALEASDVAAVLERATRAVAAGARGANLGSLRALQAIAAFWQVRYQDSADWAAEAVELLADGTPEWFRAVGSAMISTARLGKYEAFDRLLERAERPADGGPAQIICLCRGAYQLVFRGQRSWANAILARIDATVSTDQVDPLTAAHISDARAIGAVCVGDTKEGLDHTLRTVDAFRRAGDVNNACASTVTVGLLLARMGAFAEAEAKYVSTLAEADRVGSKQAAAMARFGLGWLRAIRGDAAGRAALEETVALFRQAGHPRFEGWALGAFADVEHRAGNAAASLERATHAIELLRDTPPLSCWALAMQARAFLLLGRVGDALDASRKAFDILDANGGALWDEELPPLVLAEACHASGDHAGARNAIAYGRDHLLRRAAKLEGTPWHESYLANPDAVRTLRLAAEWAAT